MKRPITRSEFLGLDERKPRAQDVFAAVLVFVVLPSVLALATVGAFVLVMP